ncbi:MAG: tetratricopeptide repeat protein [Verrucomicrobia bacterium]|nr:tetratricopeptide repeat protein [Verrucomicrobiota bacterium]
MNPNSPDDETLGSTVAEGPRVRAQIPNHQLLRCIGEGSYGEVWIARSVTGTYRAVKIVYRRNFEDDRPYEREFKGILRFEPISREHDGQVDILHVGRDDQAGYFFYVMELADDLHTGQEIKPDIYFPKTLKSVLAQRGRLPFAETLQMGIKLTAALEHLHQHNLVHRDIKPSNIIFINGAPKLADIGLVADISEARSFVGTEGFIPPEGPGRVQADLYSLGKVLYQICLAQKGKNFPELPDDFEQLPDKDRLLELNEVILKACENDLEVRYQSATEMNADLALLDKGRSVKQKRVVERRWTIGKRLALAVSALAALAFVVSQLTTTLNAPAYKASVFVLPFRNDGTNGIPDDLRGRMTDAFIDSLALIKGVRPSPRKSGWVHRDEKELRDSLAKTNDMRHILTGQIRGDGDKLAVTLRLYKMGNDKPLWTEPFSGTTNEVIALERQAIEQITSKLGLKITEEERGEIGLKLTNNLEALGWLGKARERYRTKIGFDEIMKLSQKALSQDLHYLDAACFDAYMMRLIAQDRHPAEMWLTLEQRMDAILSQDDTHAGALDFRAACALLKHDWKNFDAFSARSLESRSGQDWHWYRAFTLRIHGLFPDARAELEKAEQPESADGDFRFIMCSARWAERRYNEAIEVARRTLELHPTPVDEYNLHYWRAHCLVGKGEYDAGIDAIKQAEDIWPRQELKALLGYAYARMGRSEKAREVLGRLRELKRTIPYLQPYFVARIHAALGEKKEALALLEKAADDKSEYLFIPDWDGLRTDPAWDDLQNEPQYWDLCARLGLGKDQWPPKRKGNP